MQAARCWPSLPRPTAAGEPRGAAHLTASLACRLCCSSAGHSSLTWPLRSRLRQGGGDAGGLLGAEAQRRCCCCALQGRAARWGDGGSGLGRAASCAAPRPALHREPQLETALAPRLAHSRPTVQPAALAAFSCNPLRPRPRTRAPDARQHGHRRRHGDLGVALHHTHHRGQQRACDRQAKKSSTSLGARAGLEPA